MRASQQRIATLRLSAQGLAEPFGGTSAGLGRLLAIQGQDFPASLQVLALRSGTTAAAVAEALTGGELVRSWPMRGTLHLLRPDDLGWLLELTRERAVRSAAGRHRQLELTADDFVRAAAIATQRLDGVRATRAELLAAFRAGGVATDGQRGAHLIVRLAQDAVIVQVGKDVLARYDQAVPGHEPLPRSEALARLALGYVAGHGPVTDRDLAWWAGLTLTEARAGLAGVRDQLDVIDADGTDYFLPPGLQPAEPDVLLLPAFDEYVIGYTDRAPQLGGEPLWRLVPGSNGMFLAAVVVDGLAVGTWRRQRRGSVVEVSVQPFQDFPAARVASLHRAVQRWAELAEVDARLLPLP